MEIRDIKSPPGCVGMYVCQYNNLQTIWGIIMKFFW